MPRSAKKQVQINTGKFCYVLNIIEVDRKYYHSLHLPKYSKFYLKKHLLIAHTGFLVGTL